MKHVSAHDVEALKEALFRAIVDNSEAEEHHVNVTHVPHEDSHIKLQASVTVAAKTYLSAAKFVKRAKKALEHPNVHAHMLEHAQQKESIVQAAGGNIEMPHLHVSGKVHVADGVDGSPAHDVDDTQTPTSGHDSSKNESKPEDSDQQFTRDKSGPCCGTVIWPCRSKHEEPNSSVSISQSSGPISGAAGDARANDKQPTHITCCTLQRLQFHCSE
eukprot:gnl/MRDRNA2_/MRDRNA2_170998_c0_seq1.p1 gnl/MRDRNA2_/MRDRNA2_170998_c0~~gnl/MRDRNA2_/MRDRNA2_170998_c0_seq1.p1  ORF type:complete len:216 (+),score=42.03 gnl/MRDRNA2_/MRDRNA2_170998_c0_seq1:127-774(+)